MQRADPANITIRRYYFVSSCCEILAQLRHSLRSLLLSKAGLRIQGCNLLRQRHYPQIGLGLALADFLGGLFVHSR